MPHKSYKTMRVTIDESEGDSGDRFRLGYNFDEEVPQYTWHGTLAQAVAKMKEIVADRKHPAEPEGA